MKLLQMIRQMKLKLTGKVNSNSVIVSKKLINNHVKNSKIIRTTGVLIILFLTVISVEDGNDTFQQEIENNAKNHQGQLSTGKKLFGVRPRSNVALFMRRT